MPMEKTPTSLTKTSRKSRRPARATSPASPLAEALLHPSHLRRPALARFSRPNSPHLRMESQVSLRRLVRHRPAVACLTESTRIAMASLSACSLPAPRLPASVVPRRPSLGPLRLPRRMPSPPPQTRLGTPTPRSSSLLLHLSPRACSVVPRSPSPRSRPLRRLASSLVLHPL